MFSSDSFLSERMYCVHKLPIHARQSKGASVNEYSDEFDKQQ